MNFEIGQWVKCRSDIDDLFEDKVAIKKDEMFLIKELIFERQAIALQGRHAEFFWTRDFVLASPIEIAKHRLKNEKNKDK